jgi:hypothetical protein
MCPQRQNFELLSAINLGKLYSVLAAASYFAFDIRKLQDRDGRDYSNLS